MRRTGPPVGSGLRRGSSVSPGSLRCGWASLAALAVLLAPGCASPPGPVVFETATLLVSTGADTVTLRVELARTGEQQERGLAGRSSLGADRGMLFLFDEVRGPDDGFWMWNTGFPLDIAFIDEGGSIGDIVEMEPCREDDPDLCPGYFPDVPYASALEVNRGWFARNGVGIGSTVRWTPDAGGAR